LVPLWRNFYILRSSGRIQSDEELETMIKRVTQKEIPVKKIIEIILESHIIPENHIKLVKKLKKKYKVGILSNNVQEWVERVLKDFKIEGLFNVLIVSSRVGVRKPDARIYFTALKKISAKPNETIFVADEVAEDLVTATALGIKTVWLKPTVSGWWNENDKKILKFYKPDATIKNLNEIISTIKI
jgi:HAD superfamily hydrolase (TIGR01662 family)